MATGERMGGARIMTEQPYNLRSRAAALAAAVLLAAAVPLGTAWTLGLHRQQAAMRAQLAREAQPDSTLARDLEQQLGRLGRTIVFDWIGVGAAAAGAALLALASRARRTKSREQGTGNREQARMVPVPRSPFPVPLPCWAVAAAAAPAACAVLCAAPEAASQQSVPVARLVATLLATVAWLVVARPLPGRLQYGACLACLAVAALFFTWWEPPPPKAVPIARPLALLEKELLAKLPGWTGQDRRMSKAMEGQVGADEYLNLDLTPPGGGARVTVYITYNANAMSNVPHVPWVCMVQAGNKVLAERRDGVVLPSLPGREFEPNVLLIEIGSGPERSRMLMFHYFRVGDTYTGNRQVARFLATTGSLGVAGSFLSQTQVAIWPAPAEGGDPMDKSSPAYRLGLQILDLLVPLLERGYYPDLREAKTGTGNGEPGTGNGKPELSLPVPCSRL